MKGGRVDMLLGMALHAEWDAKSFIVVRCVPVSKNGWVVHSYM